VPLAYLADIECFNMLLKKPSSFPDSIAPVTDVSTFTFAAMMLQLCPVGKLVITFLTEVVCDLFV